MKPTELENLWLDADLAAAHACVLWDSELEEAYAALRDAAGRVLTALGQERTLARLLSTSHNQTQTKQ